MRALSMCFVALVLGLCAQESKASSPTLSGGISHSCLVELGRVECWGDNQVGQLGDGTTDRSLVPKAVPGITTAVQVATGYFHTCALLQDGSVLCWGLNDSGHLGLGFTSPMETSPQPTLLGGPNIAITAGGRHACALNANGKVYCWGNNQQAQLGTGFASTNEPTPVEALGTFDSLSAGAFHTCGLNQGVAYCWGANDSGQAGTGAAGGNVLIPTQVAGGETFVKISGGYEHTCAVSTDMAAYCWGSNGAGELGAGVMGADSAFPVSVADLGDVSDITAGAEFACALTSAGAVECWGSKSWGKLGVGSLAANEHQQVGYELISTPVAQLSGVTALGSTRGLHICTRTPTGRQCWGDNSSGQVGQGLPPENTALAANVTGAANTAALSSQHYHTCALSDSGTVSCWGVNDEGQLGQSHTRNLPVPAMVAGIGVVQALAVGNGHTCALNAAGEVYCWGANGFGQLGVGDFDPHLGPRKVTGLDPDVTGLSTGGAHTCALHGDKHISCWGANFVGQLGSSSGDEASAVPVNVDSAEPFSKVVLGARHSCALTDAGAVMCWGSNFNGQLGEGDFSPVFSATPVAVVNGTGATQLAAGQYHTCLYVPGQFGVGTVKCWGADTAGQLGNGPAITTDMPVPVASATGFADGLFAGGEGTCVRRSSLTTTCWGDSSHLQLGSDSNLHSPTDIAALQGLTNLAIGSDHVCGIDASGQAKCTGAAEFGQRGDGALALVPYPIEVASDRVFANGFE